MKSKTEFLKQKGASALIIIGVVLVAIIIVAVAVKLLMGPAEEPEEEKEPEESKPQYEVTIGNVKYLFEQAIDEGGVLEKEDGNFEDWRDPYDAKSTDKIIKVTIKARNVGKVNINGRSWNVGEMVDSEGRIFEPERQADFRPWLPENNKCNVLLKPGFTPSSCTKIYEVAEVSKDLKVRVITNIDNKEEYDFIDLFVVPEEKL